MLAGVVVLPGDDLLHPLGLDQAEGGGELAHPEVEAVDLVLELAVVAELAGELDQVGVWRRRALRPRRSRPSSSRRASRRRRRRSCRAGARSTRRRVRGRSPRAGRSRWLRQYSAIRSESKAMWPPMWTRIAAFGLCRSAFASKSSNDMQRSSRLQSTNSTSAPALIAASGVAMKVFEGQSTVSPRTPANSSAASAPPAQLESPTLGRPFHSRPALLEGLELARPPTTARSRAPRSRDRTDDRGRGDRTRSRTCSRRIACRRLGPRKRRKASSEIGSGSGGVLAMGASRERRRPTRRARQQDRPQTATHHESDQNDSAEWRRSPGLVEDQRCEHDGSRTWTANITGATWVAGRRCRALISLSRASPSESAAVASQAAATSRAPAASSSVSSLLAIAVQA